MYSYATGLSAGIAVAQRIQQDPRAAAEFMTMLAGGSSAPPLELLRRAGVDLSTPAPIEAAIADFDRTLTELESLLVPAAATSAAAEPEP